MKRTLIAAAASLLLALPAAAQTSLGVGVGAGTGVQVQVPGVGIGVGTGAGAQTQTQTQTPAPRGTVGTDTRASGRSSIDAGRAHRGEPDARVGVGAGVNGQVAPGNVGVGAQQGLQLGIGR